MKPLRVPRWFRRANRPANLPTPVYEPGYFDIDKTTVSCEDEESRWRVSAQEYLRQKEEQDMQVQP